MPDFSEEQYAPSDAAERIGPGVESYPEQEEEETDEPLPDQLFPVVGIGASAGAWKLSLSS